MKQAHNTRSQLILMFVAFAFGMILSNLLAQSRAVQDATEPQEEVLLTYRGLDKTLADLPEDIAERYRIVTERTHREQQSLLHAAALRWAFAEYAQDHELDLEDAAQAYLGWEAPDDQSVSRFYQEQSTLIDKPFYEVKDNISHYLGEQRARQARMLRLAEMVERGDLIVFPDRPASQRPSVVFSTAE